MRDHKITISLKSATGTPWQSDTIFGHLCWQVAYGALGMDIKSFLEPFLDRDPPFVLSDGFPTGFLPRPLLSFGHEDAKSLEEYKEQKHWRKALYYSVNDFHALCRGKKPEGNPCDDPWKPFITPHAALNRNTNTTGEKGEGGFYETESNYLQEPGEIDVYLRCQEGWLDKFLALLNAMAQSGYGRDKSVGLGVFEIMGHEPFDGFKVFDGANGFVSISSMVPVADDPIDARYRLRTKYGKLGEGVCENPFKRPLLQMEPGAVFKVNGPMKEFYGRMVTGIAPGMPEAVQNCYAFVAPCRL